MKIKWVAYGVFVLSLCWGVKYLVGGLSNLVNVTPTEYLFRMIAARDLYNVQLALEYDKRLANARNINGTPALIEALVMGGPDMVNLVVQAGGDPNVADAQGNTPLMIAVQMNDIPMTRLLLNYGANPAMTTSSGVTPLLAAINNNQRDMIATLLERESGLNAQDHEGKTPLIYAVEKGNEEIVRLLLSKGAHETVQDKAGKTVLMYAVTGNPLILNDLLTSPQAKTVINQVDKRGWSALLYAVAAKAFAQARTVIERGGDPFIVSNTGDTIFSIGDLYRATARDGGADFIAFLIDYTRRLYGPFGEELISGEPAAVEKRIKESPAGTINKPIINGLTPLHIAVIMNNVSLVDMLLRNKAEVNKEDNTGKTPLMLAVMHGDSAMVELLLNTQKTPGLESAHVAIKDKEGYSALEIAHALSSNDQLSLERRQNQERIYELLQRYHTEDAERVAR